MQPTDKPPVPSIEDTIDSYCYRLQSDGYEEMTIRKSVSEYFKQPTEEAGRFYAKFEAARLQHLWLLVQIEPNRSRYSLMKKVSKNLGITEEEAVSLIDRL
ncbi:MAG: hypothetical protein AAFN91_16245 [Pseudomonadota bacterium]